MLKQRIISAILGIPPLIAIIWFGDPWYTSLIAVSAAIGAFEFYRMVSHSKCQPATFIGLVWCILFVLSPAYPPAGLTMPWLTASAVVLSFLWLLLRRQRAQLFTNWAWTLAGILYMGWMMSHLVALRGLEMGREWVLLALLTTFACDTTAFFAGRRWGRHHLAPAISPKKTREGAIAGLIAAIVTCVVLSNIFGLNIGYPRALSLGIFIGISGQLGDLAESYLKRKTRVKDSGKLIPGHGGILDRLDSVIFNGIVVYYYVVWFVS